MRVDREGLRQTDMQKYPHQPQRVNDAQRQHCERVNDEEPLGIIYDENKFSNEEKC